MITWTSQLGAAGWCPGGTLAPTSGIEIPRAGSAGLLHPPAAALQPADPRFSRARRDRQDRGERRDQGDGRTQGGGHDQGSPHHCHRDPSLSWVAADHLANGGSLGGGGGRLRRRLLPFPLESSVTQMSQALDMAFSKCLATCWWRPNDVTITLKLHPPLQAFSAVTWITRAVPVPPKLPAFPKLLLLLGTSLEDDAYLLRTSPATRWPEIPGFVFESRNREPSVGFGRWAGNLSEGETSAGVGLVSLHLPPNFSQVPASWSCCPVAWWKERFQFGTNQICIQPQWWFA